MGQAAGMHALLACELRQVMRGRLAFHGGIGGDDQFSDHALRQALRQRIQPKFARAYAIQRRQAALQDEVQAAVARGLLYRKPIRG